MKHTDLVRSKKYKSYQFISIIVPLVIKKLQEKKKNISGTIR